MSSSLLDNENAPQRSEVPKKASFLYSVRMASLVFGTKDQLQATTLKAVSSEKGLPRQKHVTSLIETLTMDQLKTDEIVLCCHALSHWEKKKIVSCKILILLIILMQAGFSSIQSSYESVNSLLVSIRDKWSSSDTFLAQLAVVVSQRLNFLLDNAEFSLHFTLSSTSYNGQSLPTIDTPTSLVLLSRLLSCLERLINVINIPLRFETRNDLLTKNELSTYRSALWVLFADAHCFYVATHHILLYIYNHRDEYSVDTVNVMRNQFDLQFISLRHIYNSLQQQQRYQQNDNNSSSSSSDQGLEMTQLPRFPESNPLSDKFPLTS